MFCDNGYPREVLQSSFNTKIAQVHKLKVCDPEKCPINLRFVWDFLNKYLPVPDNIISLPIPAS